jgi:hypothetical protein
VARFVPSARQLVRQDGGGRPYFAMPDLSSLFRRAHQLADARSFLPMRILPVWAMMLHQLDAGARLRKSGRESLEGNHPFLGIAERFYNPVRGPLGRAPALHSAQSWGSNLVFRFTQFSSRANIWGRGGKDVR